MKKSILIPLLGFIVILNSCSSSDKEVSEPIKEITNYFPVGVGYAWTYDQTTKEDGIVTDTGTSSFSLGTPVNDYYPIQTSNDEEFLGFLDDAQVKSDAGKVLIDGVINLSNLGLVDEPNVVIKNFTILDEAATDGTKIDETDFTEIIEATDENPEMTIHVFIKTFMGDAQSAITLDNGKSYNKILNSSILTDIALFTTITEQSQKENVGITTVLVVIPEQQIQLVNQTEISKTNLSFAKGIGVAKSFSEVDPTNITINKIYTLNATLNGIPTTIVINMDTRTSTVNNVPFIGSITIPFDKDLNALADQLEELQKEINNAPVNTSLFDLKDYSL